MHIKSWARMIIPTQFHGSLARLGTSLGAYGLWLNPLVFTDSTPTHGKEYVVHARQGRHDRHLQALATVIQLEPHKTEIRLKLNKHLGSIFYSESY